MKRAVLCCADSMLLCFESSFLVPTIMERRTRMQSSSQIAAVIGPIFKSNPLGEAFEVYVTHRPDGSSALYRPWLISLVDLYPVLESDVIAYRDTDGQYHQVNKNFPVAGELEFAQARIHPFEPSHYKSMFIEGKVVPEIYAKAFEKESQSIEHTEGVDITYVGLNDLHQEVEFNLMRMCIALSENDDCMAFLSNRIAKFGADSVKEGLRRAPVVSGGGLWVDRSFGRPSFTQIAPEVLTGFVNLTEQDYSELNLYRGNSLKPVCMVSPFHDLKLYRYKDVNFRENPDYRSEFDFSRLDPARYRGNLVANYLKKLSSKLTLNLSQQGQTRPTPQMHQAQRHVRPTTSHGPKPTVEKSPSGSAKPSILSRLSASKEIRGAPDQELRRPSENAEVSEADLSRMNMLDSESEVDISEVDFDSEPSSMGEPPEYVTESVPSISELRAQKKSFTELASQAGLVSRPQVDSPRQAPKTAQDSRPPVKVRSPNQIPGRSIPRALSTKPNALAKPTNVESARMVENEKTSSPNVVREVTKPSFAMRGERRLPTALIRSDESPRTEPTKEDNRSQPKAKGSLFAKLSMSQQVDSEDDDDSIPTATRPAGNGSIAKTSLSKSGPGF